MFTWEGLRLLQEIQYDSPLTWVYTAQHGYEPLVQIGRVKDLEILWYHCHPNGVPERLSG